MSKRLLASRVFNDTGDWFYYFVIVVIIYTMSKNPVMMGGTVCFLYNTWNPN